MTLFRRLPWARAGQDLAPSSPTHALGRAPVKTFGRSPAKHAFSVFRSRLGLFSDACLGHAPVKTLRRLLRRTLSGARRSRHWDFSDAPVKISVAPVKNFGYDERLRALFAGLAEVHVHRTSKIRRASARPAEARFSGPRRGTPGTMVHVDSIGYDHPTLALVSVQWRRAPFHGTCRRAPLACYGKGLWLRLLGSHLGERRAATGSFCGAYRRALQACSGKGFWLRPLDSHPGERRTATGFLRATCRRLLLARSGKGFRLRPLDSHLGENRAATGFIRGACRRTLLARYGKCFGYDHSTLTSVSAERRRVSFVCLPTPAFSALR